MEVIAQHLIPKRKLYNGFEIPAIGMGTFGSDRYNSEQVSAAVKGAIKVGYRLFDCAACYQNEAEIGKVFTEAIEEGLVTRKDLYITTKVWNDMHGQGDVLISCAKSLKDLQLEYIDLFFIHWPFPNYHAPGCDVDSRNPDSKPFSVERFMKTWQQCERLVDMGLVKSIGMSNMTIAKLKAVLPLCRIKPAAIEMELHPCFPQPALFNYLKGQDILPIAFCPIGSPERPERDTTETDITDINEVEIQTIAKNHNIHPAVVCLKWAVQRGQVPIPFATEEAFYTSNLKCVTEDPLTEEEMKIIEGLDKNNRLIKGQVFLWEGANDWQDLWDVDGFIVQ